MLSRRSFLGLLAASPLAAWFPKPEWPPAPSGPGETLYWLNPSGVWKFAIVSSPTYEVRFSGFKPGDEQHIVGQIMCTPRLISRQVHGIEE